MLRSYFARHGRRSRASVLPSSWTPKGANGSRRSRPSSHQAACAHVLNGRSMEAGTDGSCLFSPWACHAKALKPAPRAKPSVLASVRLTTQARGRRSLGRWVVRWFGRRWAPTAVRTDVGTPRTTSPCPAAASEMRAQNRAAFTSSTDPSPALHEGILNYFKFSRECQGGSSRPSSESIHRLGLGGYGWMDGSIDRFDWVSIASWVDCIGWGCDRIVGLSDNTTHAPNERLLHFTSSDKR